MKKLIYVSGESFFDVDFPILKQLNKSFNLTWFPILRVNGWYSEGEITAFCKENSIKSNIILQKYKLKNPKMILFYLQLLSKIKNENADIIYFEYSGVPYLHLLSPMYLKVTKVIIAVHDVKQHYKMNFGKVISLYFDYIFKRFNNFQVFSNSQLEIFNSKQKNKNVFVGNLFLKDFGSPSILKKETEKVNFLFFGLIRENKGIELIIKAVNELSKNRKDFIITIAGFSKDWDYYLGLIEDISMFNLIIRNINNNEIPNLFEQADYVLLPYIDVTQSGVLLTAYNYCLPALASDLPGFHEYIKDGENGYLVVPTLECLTNKMATILDMHHETYDLIKENLKIYIKENIDINTISKSYVDFFNSI